MAEIHAADIGRNIKQLRIEKGIARNDLGASVGVTGQAIYQYESGKRSLKFDMIEKIAAVLDVPVDTLLGDHNFVSGKSNKVKPMPLKWSTVLNLKELLMPSGKKDEEIESMLQDHDMQMFLYGLFVRIKNLGETDRYILLQLLTGIIDNKLSIDELENISIVTSRLYSLNEDGLIHVNRLVEDVSELEKYRKTEGE